MKALLLGLDPCHRLPLIILRGLISSSSLHRTQGEGMDSRVALTERTAWAPARRVARASSRRASSAAAGARQAHMLTD